MRAHLASIVVLATSLAGVSCSSDDASHANTDAGADLDATGGASDDASGEGDAASTKARVRFAQLSPDAPALDVCIAPHGTGTFQGPLLTKLAVSAGLAPDASAPGLSFANVSAYFAIDPGKYDVRFVVAGSRTCTPGAGDGTDASADAGASVDAASNADGSAVADAGSNADAGASADADTVDAGAGAGADSGAGADASANPDAGPSGPAGPALPLPPDVMGLPAFAAGAFTTVLLAGEIAPAGSDAAFTAFAVQDETVLAGGGASLRAINALPGVPRADFGFGSFAGSWSPLFANVAFGAASVMAAPSQGKADDSGYLPIAPFGPGVFSARASSGATADVASSQSVTVPLGTVATIIAAGTAATGAAHPPGLVLCTDSAPRGGPLSVCTVLR